MSARKKPSPSIIRVLIAEDLTLVREGLRRILLEDQGLEVVGAVGNGLEVVQAINQTTPDVLLLDMDLPELYWRMVVGHPIMHAHATKALMLTSATDEEKSLRAIQAGAKGYCSKMVTPHELIKAIQFVATGEIWTSRKLLPRMVEKLTQLPLPLPPTNGARFTLQEEKVISLLGQGLSNKEMAKCLAITEATVKSHLNHVFRKTGLHSRLQLSLTIKSS